MANNSLRAFAAIALIGSSSILTIATAPAKANWLDAFSSWGYEKLRQHYATPPAPSVYPHPQTGQPVQWLPQQDYRFYRNAIGVRG